MDYIDGVRDGSPLKGEQQQVNIRRAIFHHQYAKVRQAQKSTKWQVAFVTGLNTPLGVANILKFSTSKCAIHD